MSVVARLNQYASLQSHTFDEVTFTTNKVNTSGIFSNEFEEDRTAQLQANIYSPYDLITGEIAMASYGSGQGTYMKQTSTNKCIVYNEIDEITPII